MSSSSDRSSISETTGSVDAAPFDDGSSDAAPFNDGSADVAPFDEDSADATVPFDFFRKLPNGADKDLFYFTLDSPLLALFGLFLLLKLKQPKPSSVSSLYSSKHSSMKESKLQYRETLCNFW